MLADIIKSITIPFRFYLIQEAVINMRYQIAVQHNHVHLHVLTKITLNTI